MDEPPGEETNYDMEMLLGLEGFADGDIGTTNIEHKECGDQDRGEARAGQVKQGFF